MVATHSSSTQRLPLHCSTTESTPCPAPHLSRQPLTRGAVAAVASPGVQHKPKSHVQQPSGKCRSLGLHPAGRSSPPRHISGKADFTLPLGVYAIELQPAPGNHNVPPHLLTSAHKTACASRRPVERCGKDCQVRRCVMRAPRVCRIQGRMCGDP